MTKIEDLRAEWKRQDRRSERLSASFVACPTCKSKRFTPCYTPKGNATHPHAARIKANEERQAQRRK